MATETLDLLNEATQTNLACPLRQGNIVYLPNKGSLIVTGDLHGHERNFERIVAFSDLPHHPDRHVVFQEIIHGGPQSPSGGCLSFRILFDVIRFKMKFPHQVHLILGNHDTASITGAEVMKDSREMNRAFRQALSEEFGGQAEEMECAINRFLISQPLAVTTDNCIWMSHSLPSDRLVDLFDTDVFQKDLTKADCIKPGSAYILTWGRNMSQNLLNRMAQLLKTEVFILGHQAQPQGWTKAGDNLIIIASDHNHGCLVCLDLESYYSADHVINAIKPLSSIK
jgi:hypothetical protein